MPTRAAEATPPIYARVAGLAFIVYIVVGISGMALPDRPGLSNVTYLLTAFCALTLAVTLYLITRAAGPAMALLAMTARIAEAISGEAALAAIFFAVGSLLFCWLFLRGRIIPAVLAWLGLLASALLVVILPLQELGLLSGQTSWASSLTWLIWMPMLVFELSLALWLIVKGAAAPISTVPSPRPDFVV
jgi:hypothetical protein